MDSVMQDSHGKVLVSADGIAQMSDYTNAVFMSRVGSKEADVCANRGLCSFTDGICACYNTNGDAYGSSDGYGAAGSRGDCG